MSANKNPNYYYTPVETIIGPSTPIIPTAQWNIYTYKVCIVVVVTEYARLFDFGPHCEVGSRKQNRVPIIAHIVCLFKLLVFHGSQKAGTFGFHKTADTGILDAELLERIRYNL